MQNLRPRWDRRVLAVVIGVVTTGGAGRSDLGSYQSSWCCSGSVFVPLAGVLVVDFFLLTGRRWSFDERSPARWSRVVPWALGFVTYQLVNPGSISWWVTGWQHVDTWLHFTPPSWLSASLFSFAVAAVLTPLCAAAGSRLAGPRALVIPVGPSH